MLKAILKMHQTTRELTSTVWDTLLINASSPEADNMQKADANISGKGAERGARASPRPTLRVGVPGPGQVSSAERHKSGSTKGTGNSELPGPTGSSLSLSSPNMRRGAILQTGQNVQSRCEENNVKHRVTGKTTPRSRSTQSNRGRAQIRTSTPNSNGTGTSTPCRAST